MTGIYKIFCLVTNKCYIGQSSQIKKRITTHKRELRMNKHHSKKLQQAYNKYGAENFTYEILELCPKTKLDEREKFYIKIFDSFHNGYNMTEGGNSLGHDESHPMYGKIGKESTRYIDIIYQLDLQGNIINTFESANQASKIVSGSSSNIISCLQSWKHHKSSARDVSDRERFTHKNSYWIYEKDYQFLKKKNYDFSQKRTKKSKTIEDYMEEK